MRIAVDARELTGRRTGVGRYLAELLASWSELAGARGHEYFLFTTDSVTVPGELDARIITRRGQGTIWEQFVLPGLLSRVNADVLFAPAYTAPLRTTVPVVLTVHDVSFAAHPEWFSWREGLRRRTVTRLSARRAARVITVSDFSKQEIVRHLDVPQSRVEVIYSGITQLPDASGAMAPTQEPTVLFVGSLFNRRHIPELIAGFEHLVTRCPTVRLVIVGDNRTRPFVDVDSLITRSPAGRRVHIQSYVAEQELATLYASARAFVFLSDYEGFAMTPLEALAAGVPVVLLNTDVAHEIYGPAAIYVNRPEPVLIADALERALFDEAERARVLTVAAAQMQRYSWRECAQRTLQVLVASAR
jgi:glycosyltransferase involved in cell wall biosynthesis